jgi:hypothetical protein
MRQHELLQHEAFVLLLFPYGWLARVVGGGRALRPLDWKRTLAVGLSEVTRSIHEGTHEECEGRWEERTWRGQRRDYENDVLGLDWTRNHCKRARLALFEAAI